MSTKQRLGELLIEKGLATEKDIEAALKLQVSGNRRLGTILVKMGCVNDEKLLDVLSSQQGMPRTNIDKEFDGDVKNILPKYLCRKYSIIPLCVEIEKNVLKVAMVDPLDDEAVNDIERYTGKAVWGIPATEGEVERAIAKHIPFSTRDVLN